MAAGVVLVVGPARRGRPGPDLAGVVVAQVEEAAGAVLGQVLLPAHEDAELGVVDPAKAAARLRHGEADPRVGDDIDPGARRARVGDDVLGAVVGEVAVAAGRQRLGARLRHGVSSGNKSTSNSARWTTTVPSASSGSGWPAARAIPGRPARGQVRIRPPGGIAVPAGRV